MKAHERACDARNVSFKSHAKYDTRFFYKKPSTRHHKSSETELQGKS